MGIILVGKVSFFCMVTLIIFGVTMWRNFYLLFYLLIRMLLKHGNDFRVVDAYRRVLGYIESIGEREGLY